MFDYYHTYYGNLVGTQIRKQIGKNFIYRRRGNQQEKYPYVVPSNPRTPTQQANRNRIRIAVLAWQALSEQQKNSYRSKEPIVPIMSGYNFFIREYIETL